jgi:hypothetical protein
MNDYSTQNSRRLERYYEKAGKERGKNPSLFDNRVRKGYDILKKIANPHAHERY